MDISIGIETTVSAGFDDVGNPVTHSIHVAVSDESGRNEDDIDASIRVSHVALGTLAHTVGHLLSEQPEEILAAALKKVGVNLEDEDEEEGDWHNEMPPHPEQNERGYGWHDGTPPDDLDDAGSESLIGRIPKRRASDDDNDNEIPL